MCGEGGGGGVVTEKRRGRIELFIEGMLQDRYF